MLKDSAALALMFLTYGAVECRSQVLSPPEILDPDMRVLQQKHFSELKAAAVDITAHEYPYKFYLSRMIDITQQQEQLTDQRSIRFANFMGEIVLQVTGNYFAAYSDRAMDRDERIKRTYIDVMVPILRAAAPRLAGEPKLTAFAMEISHHVRRQVLGVTVENPENVVLVVPRAVAQKVAKSNDVVDQITALRASSVYVDGNPVAPWPNPNAESMSEVPRTATPTALRAVPAARAPAPPLTRPAPPIRDLSVQALQQQQASHQELLDRIVHEVDDQAHFVSYAPPALIAFHQASYLQLSVTTTLAPSDAGSQYRVAALAFDRHVSHLVRLLLAYFKQDPDFDGIVFSSTVKIAGKSADSSLAQSVEFFLPLTDLRL